MNNLAGERGGLDEPLMPRVGVEPLALARVSGVRGGLVGADFLRRDFTYDPETGDFTRLRGRRPGLAGAINNLGYRLIGIGGKKYRAHRLAWLYVHGDWPTGEIDHINGVRDDNRIENLRDVPMVVNQQNRRSALARNNLGLLGVSRAKGRYKATIHSAGRDIHLGLFKTADEAHAAYLDAKRELHAGCTL